MVFYSIQRRNVAIFFSDVLRTESIKHLLTTIWNLIHRNSGRQGTKMFQSLDPATSYWLLGSLLRNRYISSSFTSFK